MPTYQVEGKVLIPYTIPSVTAPTHDEAIAAVVAMTKASILAQVTDPETDSETHVFTTVQTGS